MQMCRPNKDEQTKQHPTQGVFPQEQAKNGVMATSSGHLMFLFAFVESEYCVNLWQKFETLLQKKMSTF